MKCTKAKKWISQYTDGDLDSRRSAELKRHLEGCPKCRELLEDFKDIAVRAADLDELLPSDRVWEKIQAGMRERRTPALVRLPRWKDSFLFHPAFPRYAVSTAVVLVLVVSLAVLVPRFWQGRAGLTADGGPEYALSKLEEAEYHYQKAIKALSEAASVQKKGFDSETAIIFQKNLELIDISIAACRRTILNDPDDVEIRDYLLTALQRKAELLNLMMEFSTAPSYTQETNKTL